MNRSVTIVMYHYVRDLVRSRYPRILGLTVEAFSGQLEYLRRHYNILDPEDVLDAAAAKAELPPRSLMLTFDDAFADHYTVVFPILDRLGLKAAFFPPVRILEDHTLLDVNKIHFILASQPDTSVLLEKMYGKLDELRPAFGLPDKAHYQNHVDISGNRWDTPDVAFLKRMLQRELPEDVRHRVVNALFHEYVSTDEAAFSCELYMNLDQMKCMHRHGMYFGNHGYSHSWLNRLTPDRQRDEIRRSLAFMREIGSSTDRWIMNYPYGGWNESLLTILREFGCTLGLTTGVDIADLNRDDPLLLPRLNTNDLPMSGDAPTNQWYEKALLSPTG